ncbi:MAG: hypothetical protein LBG86_02135 [Puniceicoccales bacterium]|nr:hypothetical protein [Puniceicoccales bacterium]
MFPYFSIIYPSFSLLLLHRLGINSKTHPRKNYLQWPLVIIFTIFPCITRGGVLLIAILLAEILFFGEAILKKNRLAIFSRAFALGTLSLSIFSPMVLTFPKFSAHLQNLSLLSIIFLFPFCVYDNSKRLHRSDLLEDVWRFSSCLQCLWIHPLFPMDHRLFLRALTLAIVYHALLAFKEDRLWNFLHTLHRVHLQFLAYIFYLSPIHMPIKSLAMLHYLFSIALLSTCLPNTETPSIGEVKGMVRFFPGKGIIFSLCVSFLCIQLPSFHIFFPWMAGTLFSRGIVPLLLHCIIASIAIRHIFWISLPSAHPPKMSAKNAAQLPLIFCWIGVYAIGVAILVFGSVKV